MQTMYHGNLLGRNKPNDILQEVLPNVIAGHVVQSYIGSYGAMIHPVGACATAAISVEEGVDKIRLGKAEFVVAGGYDDLTLEAIIGFGDMAATADTEMMRAKGISDSKFSRANDRRRLGFVEGQGGGTILLARGDLALKMGLPVLAVRGVRAVASVTACTRRFPAPGLGALAAGRGGKESQLARSLAQARASAPTTSRWCPSTTPRRWPTIRTRPSCTSGWPTRWVAPPVHRCSSCRQKSLTGHAKGGAAAFQMMGLCQILRDGVIPPNRSLDCVDDELASAAHLVWVRETLRLGEKFPLKAGLVTSLGFGHVSGLVALVHPQAFLAALDPEQREDYQARVGAPGAGRPAPAGVGDRRRARRCTRGLPTAGSTTMRRRSGRRPTMLLDPASRLGEDDVYVRR